MKRVLVGLLCTTLSVPAHAELVDLRTWASASEAQGSNEYLAVRCAGLSQSLLSYLDSEGSDAALAQGLRQGSDLFASMAVLMRTAADNPASETAASADVRMHVDYVAMLYVRRMDENLAKAETAFDNDDLILFDFELCGTVLQQFNAMQQP